MSLCDFVVAMIVFAKAASQDTQVDGMIYFQPSHVWENVDGNLKHVVHGRAKVEGLVFVEPFQCRLVRGFANEKQSDHWVSANVVPGSPGLFSLGSMTCL